tara:strand:- start:661 stop:1257 length:597 start_codon:yes stop_codon:yes gene_type:complete
MPIKKDKKDKKKPLKKRVKKEVIKQTQKQTQSVVVNVIKEKVKRRRAKPKPVVATRFIQTFQPQQQLQANMPFTDQLYPQGQPQGLGIRLGGREPVAKAEFYEPPIQEAVSLPFVEAESNIGKHHHEPIQSRVGRPKKYNTEEEKRLARLEASKRFRDKQRRLKDEAKARNAPNMIERRNIIDDEAITDLNDFMKKTE